MTLNAYLGARPIAAALAAGADVVVTGRCVDSAVVLGPLLHEFGWKDDEYDLLSAGSLVGHIVECGPQVHRRQLHRLGRRCPGWDDMGYPIAECRSDGTAIITKPDGTGGLVTAATVGEQIALRDRRPRRVPAARRHLRLARGHASSRTGPTACASSGARGAAAAADLQGHRDARRRLPRP